MSVPSLPLPLRLPDWTPGPVWRRRGRLGALVLLVALLHGALIGPVYQPLGRQPGRPPAMQLVTLPPAAVHRVAEDPTLPTPTPVQAPVPATPPPLLAAPSPNPAPATAPDARPVDWTAGPLAPEAVSSTETPTPESGNEANRGAGSPGPADAAASDDGGRRPPTYAAAASDQPMKLDYRVERGDDAGSGQLSWEPQADGQYRARFWGEAGNSALMDWVSRGRHAATGLAPERMVERQRGVEVRAVESRQGQDPSPERVLSQHEQSFLDLEWFENLKDDLDCVEVVAYVAPTFNMPASAEINLIRGSSHCLFCGSSPPLHRHARVA